MIPNTEKLDFEKCLAAHLAAHPDEAEDGPEAALLPLHQRPRPSLLEIVSGAGGPVGGAGVFLAVSAPVQPPPLVPPGAGKQEPAESLGAGEMRYCIAQAAARWEARERRQGAVVRAAEDALSLPAGTLRIAD